MISLHNLIRCYFPWSSSRAGFIFTIAFVILTFQKSHALVNPDIRWNTLETPHFEIIYDARHPELAHEYAAQAERAHSLLAPLFQHFPDKTVILLNDWTDVANGMATSFPRPIIIIYPVLPTLLDSIGHYDNWSQQIVLHEYAHILSLEGTTGILAPFRFLLGSIVKPVGLMPRWYLEGFAVEMESRFTPFGRLRSPFYQAATRAMIRDQTWDFDTLARINEAGIPTWPYGLRPYFWGSLLLHDIVEEKGLQELVALNDRYTGRFPFFINGPVEDLLGVNYAQLLRRVRRKYDGHAQKQIQAIQNVAVFPQEGLSEDGELGHSPQISPDRKKLIFISNNADGDSEIKLLTRSDLKKDFHGVPQTLYVGRRINRVSWDPGSRYAVFDQLVTSEIYSEHSDLFEIDTETKKTKALTKRMRAIEPMVSADGKSLAFVQIGHGKTSLTLSDRSGKNARVIYEAGLQVRVSRPSFYSSNEIIFSERTTDGKERLMILDFAANKTRRVLEAFQPAQNPQPTSAGLLFTSEKTGVSNLYLASRDFASAKPLTNTTSKVLMGIVDESTQKIYLSEMTGDGSKIFRQKIPNRSFQPPTIADPHTWSEYDEPQRVTSATNSEYSPLSYLWPQYWMPLFSLVPDGVFLQASTSASDPLETHSYALDITYDSIAAKAGGAFGYGYALGSTIFTVGADYQPVYYYGLDLTTTVASASAGVSFPLSRYNKNWRVTTRWSYLSTELFNRDVYYQSGPALGIKYDNTSRKNSGISPTSGSAIYLEHQEFLKDLGNTSFGRTRFNLSHYHSKWLPDRNAILLRSNSVWSPANRSPYLGSTAGGDYSFTFNEPPYVIRGYPVGQYLGWSIATGTLEYRFPLTETYHGWDTFPLFFKRWHAGVFVDAITLDGYYYNYDYKRQQRTRLGTFYYGTGVELRNDITLAYHVPATFRFGIFYGLNRESYGGLEFFLGLTLPRF